MGQPSLGTEKAFRIQKKRFSEFRKNGAGLVGGESWTVDYIENKVVARGRYRSQTKYWFFFNRFLDFQWRRIMLHFVFKGNFMVTSKTPWPTKSTAKALFYGYFQFS